MSVCCVEFVVPPPKKNIKKIPRKSLVVPHKSPRKSEESPQKVL